MRWFNLNEEMEGERGRSRGGFVRASARLGSGDRGRWRSRRRQRLPWFLYGRPTWGAPLYFPTPVPAPPLDDLPPRVWDATEEMEDESERLRVWLQPRKNGSGWSLKTAGRPPFDQSTKQFLAKRDPNLHKAGTTTLKPNLSRNHIFPNMAMQKKLRTLVRGKSKAGIRKILVEQAGTIQNARRSKKYNRLAKNNFQGKDDIENGSGLLLRDWFNNRNNLHVGNSQKNSSDGATMAQKQRAISDGHKKGNLPEHIRLKHAEDFKKIGLDFPEWLPNNQKKAHEDDWDETWGKSHSGKYRTG